jgi:alcohol dehydrogenase class IV/amino acid transporter
MTGKKTSSFAKVLGSWDILMIAFGAMIGWSWVVSTGDWIARGGVLGAALGFVFGGIMVFFVGLTYAELTGMMPQCGGEHVFSYRALGPAGSYVCTWAIILGYVGVVCFEALALPTIFTYLWPGFLKGYLYTVEGFDIYASWIAAAIFFAIVITWINIRGVKTAAKLQNVLTIIIGTVGILLVVASVFKGDSANIEPQAWVGDGSMSDMIRSILAVGLITPFFFIGFDVIPQAAEEINVPLRKIGKILVLSIVLAVAFYALVIVAVGMMMNPADIASSEHGTGLVTADAMARAFSSTVMAKVCIVGGMCGVVTSWNSFLMGGSRAIFSMAESYMIPKAFSKLHPVYKTPVNALLLIGALTIVSIFFGRKMLVWVADAGNFGCCLAYCMVAVSFLIIRKKEPDAERPYKVPHYKLVGVLAVILSAFMVIMYMLPGSAAALVWQEWVMVGGWTVLGFVFAFACKLKYRERFGTLVEVISDADAAALQASDAELNAAVDSAVDSAIRQAMDEKADKAARPAIAFSFFLPVNVVFGCGKAALAGSVCRQYGSKALIVTGRRSARASGLLDRVQASLKEAGVGSALFDKAEPNPLTTTAEEGARFARENGCDMVVALGGGSIMDAAKGIAFMAANDGDINDYIFGRKSSSKAMPLVCVPTTCGTGSEGNKFAVLTNPETGDKKSLRCDSIIPKASIVDPELAMGLPSKTLASVGFDALCHCIEAYTAKNSQPFTDALALYAIRLIADSLPYLYARKAGAEAAGRKYDGSADTPYWEKLMLASTIGGMVIGIAGVTLAHALEHPASGLRNITHGQGLAALAVAVIEATSDADRTKFGMVSRILGGFSADDCALRVKALLESIGLDVKLSDLGVESKDIPWMVENCQKVSAANLANTPGEVTPEMLEGIYEKCV